MSHAIELPSVTLPYPLDELPDDDGVVVGHWPRPAWAMQSAIRDSECIDHERAGATVRGYNDHVVLTPLLTVSDRFHIVGSGLAIAREQPTIDLIDTSEAERDGISLSLAGARGLVDALSELIAFAEAEEFQAVSSADDTTMKTAKSP